MTKEEIKKIAKGFNSYLDSNNIKYSGSFYDRSDCYSVFLPGVANMKFSVFVDEYTVRVVYMFGEKSKIDYKNNYKIYNNVLYFLNELNWYYAPFYACLSDRGVELKYLISYKNVQIQTMDIICVYLYLSEIYPIYEKGLYNIIYKNADPEEEFEKTKKKLEAAHL